LGQFDSVRLSGHGSGRVVSGIGSSSVGSFKVSGHIRSGRVGSVIGSSSVRLFRVSGRIESGRVGYRVI
jgi:hypothetical protein